MSETRLGCVICGMLGYWGYPRDEKTLEMFRKSHVQRHGEMHVVSWEVKE